MKVTSIKAAIAAFLMALLPNATVFAQEDVSFSHHDGAGLTWYSVLNENNKEAVRFWADHPLRLTQLRMALAQQPGTITVHIWADGGGHEPEHTEDLIEPITVNIDTPSPWLELDLPGDGLEIKPETSFYIGLTRHADGPGFLMDSQMTAGVNLVYGFSAELNQSMWFGLVDDEGLGDYLVDAIGVYDDIVSPEEQWFEDQTDVSGLTTSGRVSFADYDNDGDLDLLVSGSSLFRNDGEGVFTDVTGDASGVGASGHNGGVWADYNNDGWLDFYATGGPGEAHDRLYQNQGDGTFKDVTIEAGSPYDQEPSEAAAWGDFDRDGFVDLYVANYEHALSVCFGDRLWRNKGDGTFEDVSLAAGIYDAPYQCGRSVAWVDVDEDGWLDIRVGNYRLDQNFMWINQRNGTFNNVAGPLGLAGDKVMDAYGHTIGSQWGDLDNDGDFDLVDSNLAHPRFIEFSDKTMLLENTGAPGFQFVDRREGSGVTFAETHSEPSLGDFDNDGDLDLVITAVYPDRESFFYRNLGDWKFEEISYLSGLRVYNGWGAAWADVNGDGWLDFYANRLFVARPELMDPNDTHHWVKFKLSGVESNKAAIGAQVRAQLSESVIIRQIEGGKGTGCQQGFIQHMGLGEEAVLELVELRWPNGLVEWFGPVEVDRVHEIQEGDGGTLEEPTPLGDVEIEVPTPTEDVTGSDIALDTHQGDTPDSVDDNAAPAPPSEGGGCQAGSGDGGTAPVTLVFAMWIFLVMARRRRSGDLVHHSVEMS